MNPEDRPKGELVDLLESAWGIIANAGHGDWTKESKDWQEAAHYWGVKAGFRLEYPDTAAKVFSGPASKPLWDSINAAGSIEEESRISKIAATLYLLGCYCQKLETKVDNLEKRLVVTDLQNRSGR